MEFTTNIDEIFSLLKEQEWNPQRCDAAVPFYDAKVICGVPASSGDVRVMAQFLPEDLACVRDTFTVSVRGDSMTDAGIEEGDIVLARGNVGLKAILLGA